MSPAPAARCSKRPSSCGKCGQQQPAMPNSKPRVRRKPTISPTQAESPSCPTRPPGPGPLLRWSMGCVQEKKPQISRFPLQCSTDLSCHPSLRGCQPCGVDEAQQFRPGVAVPHILVAGLRIVSCAASDCQFGHILEPQKVNLPLVIPCFPVSSSSHDLIGGCWTPPSGTRESLPNLLLQLQLPLQLLKLRLANNDFQATAKCPVLSPPIPRTLSSRGCCDLPKKPLRKLGHCLQFLVGLVQLLELQWPHLAPQFPLVGSLGEYHPPPLGYPRLKKALEGSSG